MDPGFECSSVERLDRIRSGEAPRARVAAS
jgi:hypothetical protein